MSTISSKQIPQLCHSITTDITPAGMGGASAGGGGASAGRGGASAGGGASAAKGGAPARRGILVRVGARGDDSYSMSPCKMFTSWFGSVTDWGGDNWPSDAISKAYTMLSVSLRFLSSKLSICRGSSKMAGQR